MGMLYIFFDKHKFTMLLEGTKAVDSDIYQFNENNSSAILMDELNKG